MTLIDEDFLNSIGKVWTVKDYPSDIVKNDRTREIVDSVCSFLTSENPKSVLISGVKGVGKSTLISMVARELKARKWFVFRGTAGELMAGQRYIGDLEQNIKRLLNELTSEQKTVWIVPRFQELYYGGRHQYSPVGILDQIMPFIENGDLKIIGEVDTGNLEKIVQFRPQIPTAFELIRIEASTKDFTLNLAKDWARSYEQERICADLADSDLGEVYDLANQYLTYQENPGAMMDLLRQTKKLTESKGEDAVIGLSSVLDSLSNITGLPRNILDDGEKLQLDDLSARFSKKVIGQEDAVETVVERIAMIKAGLTDPSKPAGVFLFVGPTGTGKTEIAKTLAEYLFGSGERLIRLDMSEFQSYESIQKILGNASETSESLALVDNIRRNPFSVVLLDEFEKAHANIWDLFLQVFDDGRLTDQRGGVADFRHCIIILTSNLGASIPMGSRIGFNSDADSGIDRNVMKAVEQTFRPEFVNRLDKIVLFNPLTRSVSKQILKGELKKILKRRGLRRRGWELDFEDSAVEFLLDKGFSSTLGARPLKRAIEKFLLAPLARTIVNHNFPKGNQFLLVSAGRHKLKVDFIDPDEPDFTWEQKKKIIESQEQKSEKTDLPSVIMDPKGLLAEFRLIEKELAALNTTIADAGIEKTKNSLMKAMSDTGFWDSTERYDVLSEVEFVDSVLAATETASSLFQRLNDPVKERLNYDAKLIKKLALRIYLLNRALKAYADELPQDAFLKVQYEKTDESYGLKVCTMYEGWAKSRGIKINEFKRIEGATEMTIYSSVSGFGAYQALKNETGYHVFELAGENGHAANKYKVKVVVLPMAPADHRLKQLTEVIDRFSAHENQKNVRRYKLGKSPLIKNVDGSWQTGRLDRVLKGDFDLFGAY